MSLHRLGTFLIAALLLGTSSVLAQKRVEAGVFLDYLGISQTSTSNFGVGARLGFRLHRDLMMEGEVAYDYGFNFDEAYINVINGNLAAIERTSIGVTHGLFGPKVQPAHGFFRPFATFKAGFVDFRLSPSLLPYSNVLSTVFGLRDSNLNAAIYPGGGIEGVLGPVGLRFELGDEIYFNRGGHNNLRITFGPTIRF
jgi:hypothetical protein